MVVDKPADKGGADQNTANEQRSLVRPLNQSLYYLNVPLPSYVHSYRKIPGDKCEGGTIEFREEIDLRTRCVSDMVGSELKVHVLPRHNLQRISSGSFLPEP